MFKYKYKVLYLNSITKQNKEEFPMKKRLVLFVVAAFLVMANFGGAALAKSPSHDGGVSTYQLPSEY